MHFLEIYFWQQVQKSLLFAFENFFACFYIYTNISYNKNLSQLSLVQSMLFLFNKTVNRIVVDVYVTEGIFPGANAQKQNRLGNPDRNN